MTSLGLLSGIITGGYLWAYSEFGWRSEGLDALFGISLAWFVLWAIMGIMALSMDEMEH